MLFEAPLAHQVLSFLNTRSNEEVLGCVAGQSRIEQSAMSHYTYEPLDPHEATIRLMTLLPGLFNDNICVTLRDYILWDYKEEIPGYEALSYTWGPVEDPIYIDITTERSTLSDRKRDAWKLSLKGRLAVTRNLALALRYLRVKDRTRALWIDAICVDQQNLEERGHQVQRMADIYRNADRVVIWIGPAAEDSPLAIETMHSLGSRIETNSRSLEVEIKSDDDAHLANPGLTLPYDDKTWSSVYSLLCRPWFKRLWIWQEVILAETAELQCGSKTLDWIAFRKAIHGMYNKPLVARVAEDPMANFATF